MKLHTLITTVLIALQVLAFGFEQVSSTVVRPPRDLKATHMIEDSLKNLSWWVPGNPYTLFYGSGASNTVITTEGTSSIDVAIKFEPEDLSSFELYRIYQMSFVPISDSAKYTLKIWEGENAENLIYVDSLESVNAKTWNYVQLKNPVAFDFKKTYYFGYNVISNGGPVIGCEGTTPKNPGKSDLIFYQGKFVSLLKEFNFAAILNMAAFIEPANPDIEIAKAIKVKNNTSVFSNLITQESENITFLKSSIKGLYPGSFNVYRNNEYIGSTTTANYTDTLSTGGFYEYAVTATYGTEESTKSESVTVGYDTDRIPVNKVITETFINIGNNEDGKPSSPVSFSAFEAITALAEANRHIAPIIYHATVLNVLAADPFANPDSEKRYLYYLLSTNGGFPLTNFNGDLYFRGGSTTENLTPFYSELADLAHQRLTPIKLDATINKTTATKYSVDIDLEKVGVYQDTGMVVHVVLTKKETEYSWYNDNIKQVKFTAKKMFPNYNGTLIEFSNDIASANIEFEVDPLESLDNYKVVAFVQNRTTKEILNGDQYNIPYMKKIGFNVMGNSSNPVKNAEILVNNNTYTTNEEGIAEMLILSNAPEIEYSISHTDYAEFKGMFLADTTTTINVSLTPVSINHKSNVLAKAYPNPASNLLTLETNSAESYSIINAQGRVIENNTIVNTKTLVDISTLESGIYLIQVNKGNDYTLLKILKK